MTRVYLDHAATTPLVPEARAAMIEAMARFGNPSSLHDEGRAAREVVDRTRAALVDRLNRDLTVGKYEFSDVIFTSGGTEAANLALVGLALSNEEKARNRIVLAAAEHACVLGTAPLLRRLGYTVEITPVDRYACLERAPEGDDLLAYAAMAVNNELGTANPDLPGERRVMDGVQAFGKTPIRSQPAALFVSAHKIGGPKGVGALLLAPGVKIRPLVAGGEQERERRGGTENVVGLAGFGVAIEALPDTIDPAPRDAFWRILEAGGGVPTVPRDLAQRTHAHFRFPGLDAETLLFRLDREGVAASAGAACSSGSVEASHVLVACGYSIEEAREAVRFSFGVGMTVVETERVAKKILAVTIDIYDRRYYAS